MSRRLQILRLCKKPCIMYRSCFHCPLHGLSHHRQSRKRLCTFPRDCWFYRTRDPCSGQDNAFWSTVRPVSVRGAQWLALRSAFLALSR
jgi:hypothetical protein